MERRIITNMEHTVSFGPDGLSVMTRQVSDMIASYNKANSYEMLPKSAEVILRQFENNLSVMVTTIEGNPAPKVLYHGSLYPNFENGEEKLLGCQVAECGSWIVHPDFRGLGVGTLGTKALLDLGRSTWDSVLFLATHKRVSAMRVSEKLGLSSVDYRNFPYLSYLTCTCRNCSESFGFESCSFRKVTSSINVGENGKVDCTLVVSDPELAIKFENNCRRAHSEIGEPLRVGEISVESMSMARRFFEWIKTV